MYLPDYIKKIILTLLITTPFGAIALCTTKRLYTGHLSLYDR